MQQNFYAYWITIQIISLWRKMRMANSKLHDFERKVYVEKSNLHDCEWNKNPQKITQHVFFLCIHPPPTAPSQEKCLEMCNYAFNVTNTRPAAPSLTCIPALQYLKARKKIIYIIKAKQNSLIFCFQHEPRQFFKILNDKNKLSMQSNWQPCKERHIKRQSHKQMNILTIRQTNNQTERRTVDRTQIKKSEL